MLTSLSTSALGFSIQSAEFTAFGELQMEFTPWGDWEHYHNYSEIVDTLLYLNDTYSDIVDVFSIGRSWQDQDIYCIKLTNENLTFIKPEVLFVGYHHARELISSELSLYFSVVVASNYGVNATFTRLLDYCEIYIVVALNVDGFDAVRNNEWQRKNTHSCDEDGDSFLDEDPPDDEDGDGFIEDLLWWNGVLWEFVRWEGVDNDGDGLLNEDWIGGVDLNRNYGYEWNASTYTGSSDPNDEDYKGPSPFSEPETQALRDLALAHEFKYALSFHSGVEVILYPWGYTSDPSSDDQKFQEIASEIAMLVDSPYQQSSQLYTASGTWDDWMYGNRSTFGLTCEIYGNHSAWQYDPGPYQNSYWERGVFQFFNPEPRNIESVVRKWFPAFTYLIDRAISESNNIVITQITPQKIIVEQGVSLAINTTIESQGEYTYIFNVTVTANSTIIQTWENISLEGSNFTTVGFIWNTTDLIKGNYTIAAFASPVPNETDTQDNTLDDRWIFLTILGDVSADGRVDITDIVMTIEAYGKTNNSPGWDQPEWYTNMDVNNDNKIDITDIVVVIDEFGNSWVAP
ncbi:MAG: hypothetical protein JSV51_04795 [Candidatus Bathyarchaeota archaeon]|nr:MAG: hypothetical protein JSV51_04795 [Candidatus Bathyarchaeota archaeon]